MRHTSGHLAPLRTDLPAERVALANALRAQFRVLLPTSVREYARKQALQASTVTRYLSGAVLPSEDFINDLVDEVQLRLQAPQPGQPRELLSLMHAAQDAQSGTWGHAKRLQKQAAALRDRLESLALSRQELLEENRELRNGHSSASESIPQQLRVAQNRIAELERERTALLARLDDSAAIQLPETRAICGGYWRFYRESLQARGWSAQAIANADSVATSVLTQLADPSASAPNHRKGLVIAQPGSGRTAAATGLIAKAVDAGYRLVIVLGGNLNTLRRQVQERLDEALPSLPDEPAIVRLTGPDLDYSRLGPRLRALEFEKQQPDQPLNSPENLNSTAVRLLVIKKNAAVLRKLNADLNAAALLLTEVPTLVVDLDTDIAQPGSAVDRHVRRLLHTLPNAQYVAYTHSPFVNLPADNGNDFIVDLPKPTDYFGPDTFHDAGQEASTEQLDLARSGEAAFVRRVDPHARGLLASMDAFVLTGAMKIHRASQVGEAFARHTLFVHGSARLDEQEALRAQLATLWQETNYSSAESIARLRKLFEADILPVSRARNTEVQLPSSFDELTPAIETALNRIGKNPIARKLDTDADLFWKIFVSNSRTVGESASEGLTILHVRDSTGPTTMFQLSDIWFGFRPHYTDLVRLYTPPTSHSGRDLYAELSSIWHTSENLRREMLELNNSTSSTKESATPRYGDTTRFDIGRSDR
ncbi:Z1 domain-containing protein [Amycolatopsis halotolerans]|uniref:Z1 domain-containing protein n=1 Tax=Amycolatopsis halotolerans TaxID=330083 RepID=A0ABV7QJM4_9PSEU